MFLSSCNFFNAFFPSKNKFGILLCFLFNVTTTLLLIIKMYYPKFFIPFSILANISILGIQPCEIETFKPNSNTFLSSSDKFLLERLATQLSLFLMFSLIVFLLEFSVLSYFFLKPSFK